MEPPPPQPDITPQLRSTNVNKGHCARNREPKRSLIMAPPCHGHATPESRVGPGYDNYSHRQWQATMRDIRNAVAGCRVIC